MAKFLILYFLGFIVALEAVYPPNFYHHEGCLYAYMDDGHYQITLPDAEAQSGALTKIQYDKKTTACTKGLQPGYLTVIFLTADNNMESMSIEFQIKPSPSEGYWEVNKATLKINPINKSLFPNDTIELKPVDIYAGQAFSYSCAALTLQNLRPAKDAPQFQLTLKRFQLQPFAELPNVIFGPSYDCSVWITLPVVMGLVLILFIVFTVMVGVYLMLELGNQTSDLKFSKQGGMLMNQAQLDATKG